MRMDNAKTFDIVKKGYDPRAVEEYLRLRRQEHVDQLQTAKERARLLSEEVEDLRRQVDALKQNEARVTKLLCDVQALADNTRRATDAYRNEEMARLAQFRDKWTDYATTYLHQNLADFAAKLDEYAYDYAHRVQQNLNENLFLMADPLWADYRAECARTADYSQTPVLIDELLERLQRK